MADELHQEQLPAPDLDAIERQVLAENLAAQREVLALEDFALRRLLFTEPDFNLLTFTDRDTHNPKGDQHDPWNGIFIANPLGQAIRVAFEVGAAPLGLVVPARTWLCVPQKFVNASISVGGLTAATDPAVIFVRLRFPPAGASAGPYGADAPTSTPPTDFSGAVGAATGLLIPANPARKGLAIVNDSANVVYLGLGAAAVLGKGERLNANGGTWDGLLGLALWTGAINAIATAGGSNVTALEAI